MTFNTTSTPAIVPLPRPNPRDSTVVKTDKAEIAITYDNAPPGISFDDFTAHDDEGNEIINSQDPTINEIVYIQFFNGWVKRIKSNAPRTGYVYIAQSGYACLLASTGCNSTSSVNNSGLDENTKRQSVEKDLQVVGICLENRDISRPMPYSEFRKALLNPGALMEKQILARKLLEWKRQGRSVYSWDFPRELEKYYLALSKGGDWRAHPILLARSADWYDDCAYRMASYHKLQPTPKLLLASSYLTQAYSVTANVETGIFRFDKSNNGSSMEIVTLESRDENVTKERLEKFKHGLHLTVTHRLQTPTIFSPNMYMRAIYFAIILVVITHYASFAKKQQRSMLS